MTETANQNYPLVDLAAPQTEGAARINQAVTLIDVDIAALIAALALKADSASIGPAISAAIEDLRDGAPGALDTLFEIAEKLADQDDAVTAILAAIASKADSSALAGKQDHHATLDAWAAFNSNGILVQTGVGTFVARTVAGTTDQVDVTNGSGGAGNITVALAAKAKATGKQGWFIPAAAMKPRATNGPAMGSVETTTNKNMLVTYDFDASTQEFLQFNFTMPKSWDKGTVTCAFHWKHASTSTNFGVAWSLAAVAFSDDETLDAAFGTAVVVTDTGGTTIKQYTTTESSPITVAGTISDRDLVMFQAARVPSDAGDTMAIDAGLIGIELFINTVSGNDA